MDTSWKQDERIGIVRFEKNKLMMLLDLVV